MHDDVVMEYWTRKDRVAGGQNLPYDNELCYKLVIALALDDYGKYTTRALLALAVYFPWSSREC